MTTTETLAAATALLAAFGEAAYPEPNRLDVSITPDQLLAAVHDLKAANWGHLAAITGLDGSEPAPTMEVLYHFCAGAAIVTLRVRVAREAPEVPSLHALVPSASLFERELHEMFGVTVRDSPNNDPLFLPEGWPADTYPLRKDARLNGA